MANPNHVMARLRSEDKIRRMANDACASFNQYTPSAGELGSAVFEVVRRTIKSLLDSSAPAHREANRALIEEVIIKELWPMVKSQEKSQ